MATKNVQLMTQGEVLQFRNCAATESADKNRNDETQEREHAGDTTAAHPKTLDFSTRLEFSVQFSSDTTNG
jgi:hypothetical protein